jgi:hypothetical protein
LVAAATILDAGATLVGGPNEPWVLLGSAASHQLRVSDVSLGFELRGPANGPEFRMVLGTSKLEVVLDLEEGDSFLHSLLEGGTHTFTASGRIVWSSKTGLTLEGRGSLMFEVPLNQSVGAVVVSGFCLALKCLGRA